MSVRHLTAARLPGLLRLCCSPSGVRSTASMASPPASKPNPPMQFYRRKLPDTCVSFNSDEGKQIFKEALSSGHMECYFGLAAQFRTQDEPAYCGISTIVMVLNTLEVDPRRIWKGVWRWYHEAMIDCCVPLEQVMKSGINIEQFACMASCNTLDVTVTRPTETTEEDFRNTVKRLSTQDQEIIVASYSRAVFGQTGSGHFSPIGGYHPGRDMVLILDTARFKYPPHWVSLSLLYEAMRAIDPDTGLPRAFITMKKSGLFPMVMFRLSDQLNADIKSPTSKQGEGGSVQKFIDTWDKWLDEEAAKDADPEQLIEEAIQELVSALASFTGDDRMLTTQVNSKCRASLSPEHACALGELKSGLENASVFQAVQRYLCKCEEFPAAVHSAGLAVGQTKCMKSDTEKPCKQTLDLAPHHFLTVILLMWPYRKSEGRTTKSSLLSVYMKKELKQMPAVLQNEMSQLTNQLENILGYVQYRQLCSMDQCCAKSGIHTGTCRMSSVS